MMDDTVLLSTSREGIRNKIKILYDYCNSHGMTVNNSKTMFMVINGSNEDKQPISINDNIINYTKQYV